MSREAVATFCKAIAESPDLQAEVQRAYDNVSTGGRVLAFNDQYIPCELVDIAAKHGHEFTEDELAQTWGQVSELSDADLAGVAGGASGVPGMPDLPPDFMKVINPKVLPDTGIIGQEKGTGPVALAGWALGCCPDK